jgi:E3 SUMO-protein ligase PIAS1
MASSGQSSELSHLVALIKTLTNPQLKDLLRNEGLAVSGVKISLQLRIIDYLERLAVSEGNGARYDALRRLIFHTAVPGTSSFQANAGFQHQGPTVSHPAPSQARSTPLGTSMSPHSPTGLPSLPPIIFDYSSIMTQVTLLLKIVLSLPSYRTLPRLWSVKVSTLRAFGLLT